MAGTDSVTLLSEDSIKMNESGFTDNQEKFLTKLSTGHRETYDRYHDDRFNKNASDYTGKDVSTPEGKKYVQDVWTFTASRMEKSKLVAKTFIVEIVKYVFMAAIIYFGLKAGV